MRRHQRASGSLPCRAGCRSHIAALPPEPRQCGDMPTLVSVIRALARLLLLVSISGIMPQPFSLVNGADGATCARSMARPPSRSRAPRDPSTQRSACATMRLDKQDAHRRYIGIASQRLGLTPLALNGTAIAHDPRPEAPPSQCGVAARSPQLHLARNQFVRPVSHGLRRALDGSLSTFRGGPMRPDGSSLCCCWSQVSSLWRRWPFTRDDTRQRGGHTMRQHLMCLQRRPALRTGPSNRDARVRSNGAEWCRAERSHACPFTLAGRRLRRPSSSSSAGCFSVRICRPLRRRRVSPAVTTDGNDHERTVAGLNRL